MSYTLVNNNSSVSANQNVIIPEVYAELVREKIPGKTKVFQFAKKVGDLFNRPGETLTFPAWRYIGDATNWDGHTAMSLSQMQQVEKSATVYAIAAPGVNVSDLDDAVAYGKALTEAAEQQSISIARKLDKDAIDVALTSPLKKAIASATAITQAELIEALSLYGDSQDYSEFDAIVINSALAPSFYAMPLFINNTMTTAVGGNGIVRNGEIGKFLGISVVLSDRLYDATNQENFGLIMKKNAISFIPKENIFAEVERVPAKRENNIYCSQFLAMCLTDESAIVVLKKTI